MIKISQKKLSILLIFMMLLTVVSIQSKEIKVKAQSNLSNSLEFDPSSKLQEFTADLDGDNQNETISLYYNSNQLNTIEINGQLLSINLFDGFGEDSVHMRVIDLNKKDKYKEIEYKEDIANDFEHIVLLSYKNNKIVKLIDYGFFTGVNYDYSGNITFSRRSQLLYTWGYKEKYTYDGTSLKHIPTKYYELNSYATVVVPIKVQNSTTDKRVPFTLKKGEKVKIVTADGKGWFKLINSKKKAGWFYVNPSTAKIQGIYQWKVFSGLPLAG